MKIFSSTNSPVPLFISLIISAVIITVVGILYYNNEKDILIKQSSAHLKSSASFNETQINNWYMERLSDAKFLFNDKLIHENIKKITHTLSKKDSLMLANVISPMYHNHDYKTIMILNKNLKVLVNLNYEIFPDSEELSAADKSFKSNHIENSSIERNQFSRDIYMDFYIPLYNNDEPLAVIVLSVAPEKLLYSFLEGNPLGFESSAAILYAVENDSLINLSPLRNPNFSPLEHKLPIKNNLKITSTSSENNSIKIYKDYRDENVLADVRYLKLTNWYLVNKIDLFETYEPLQFKVISSGIIIFLIILIVSLLFIYFRNKQKLLNLKKLNETEIKYKQIIENASEGIIIFNNNLEIIQVNPIACRDLKYSEEELLQKKIPSLLDPTHLQKHPLKLKELVAGRTIVSERYLLRKDKSVFLADMSAKMLPDKTFMVIAKDITKKHEIEVNIRNSEKKFRSLFESSNDTIMLMDDITIIDCNPKAELLFGKSKSEIIGKTPIDFSPKFQPDGSSSEINAVKKINKVYKGKPQLFEWVHLNNKKEIYCEINLSLSEFNNKPILIAIVRDITERKNIEKELILSKERAEDMSNLKSNFLANMSHELRTPMVGILGFSQILKDEVTDSEQLEMIKSIHHGGKRLMETLNSILELTQIESKQHIINYKLLNLNDLIKSKLINFKSEAEIKNISLNFEEPNEKIKIVTDERLLKIVLRHLVSNAIKFTERGSVTLKVKKTVFGEKDKIIISIQDTGIGISAESRDIIFNEFRQASEGLNRKYEGAGLGLTITKKFIKLLDGDIEFESTIGRGSTFKVILPAIDDISQIKKVRESHNRVRSDILIQKEDEKKHGSPLNILVVEDDPNTISLFKIYLKNNGNVDVADNVKLALEKTDQYDYDLILMDINLGGDVDGLMLTKMLRETEKYSSTPIIAVTAFAMEADRKNAFDAGCTNYLSKPFDKNTLLNMISDSLNHSIYPAS